MKQYWQRNTVRNDTVKRLFNLQITIIYHGFTVVTLNAPWYCGRNVGYSYGIVLFFIINLDMY